MAQFFDNEKDIHDWLKSMSIKEYKIHPNLIVDVYQDAEMICKNLTHLPIQFGVIKGNFDCAGNQLTSLLGSPHTVSGYFDCSENKLTSFEYAPRKVGESFLSNYNNIKNLDFLATKIKGQFYCLYSTLQINHSLNPLGKFNFFQHVCGKEEDKIQLFKEDYTQNRRNEFILVVNFDKFKEKNNQLKIKEEKAYLETIASLTSFTKKVKL